MNINWESTGPIENGYFEHFSFRNKQEILNLCQDLHKKTFDEVKKW